MSTMGLNVPDALFNVVEHALAARFPSVPV